MSKDQQFPNGEGLGPDDETADVPTEEQPRAAADPLVGKVLDQRYRLVSLLAKGGMGRVYRAEQAPLGRPVAVKVLDVGLLHQEDQDFRRRFIHEAETSSRLTHPNTVRVFDYGKTWDDVLYIAMELLEGRNLFQVIRTDAPMDPIRVARIGRQIAASLREAHTLGLIHRDLKPSNVILTRPGGDEEFVKVVDFGLAKEIRSDPELTRGDALVGSPSYMSPEQVRSAALDERSDVYALGVVLYACCCGRPPFSGATALHVLMGHLNQPPPPMHEVCPSMKRAHALEATILRCLEKAPDDRYADMDAVLEALLHAEEELRGSAGRPAPHAETAPPRHPAVPVPPVPPRAAPPPGPPLILPRRSFLPLVLVTASACAAAVLGATWWALTRPAAPSTAAGPGIEAPAPPAPDASDTVTPDLSIGAGEAPASELPAAELPVSPAAQPPAPPPPTSSPRRAAATRSSPPAAAPADTTPKGGSLTPPPDAGAPAPVVLPASTGSPAAPVSDTPASAGAPPSTPAPAPATRKPSSDVRDPWEER